MRHPLVDVGIAPVIDNVAGASVTSFPFEYDGDTLGGAAGTGKMVIFECEGDSTQAMTVFTITRQKTVTASCVPGLETNV